ncbi:protein GLUTAMINE DUMPER 5-like [Sesbania bispinosa]|nr:protein GLUTAMINE DUMPER 5-like [Sesbania bispinosa]
MRPEGASNSTTMAIAAAGADFRKVTSPVPYLFGGLAVMLALIAVALIILACSYRNEEKPTKTVEMTVDSEPKIVVIMAGDTNPTYLAKPAVSTSTWQSTQSEAV